MTCEYPQNTPLSGYRKGCRCGRCREAKAVTDRRRSRPSPCHRCGGPKPIGGWYCATCEYLVILERITDRIEVDANGCWLYEGRTDNYARMSLHRGLPSTLAHRFMYEHIHGPAGALEVDHLCCIKGCVNPDHLEAVTKSENALRYHRKRREAQPIG